MIIAREMASRFAEPVSDDAEQGLRATAVPANTKATTDWGIVYGKSGLKAELVKLEVVAAPVTTPLLELSPEDLAYWMGKFGRMAQSILQSPCMLLCVVSSFISKRMECIM